MHNKTLETYCNQRLRLFYYELSVAAYIAQLIQLNSKDFSNLMYKQGGDRITATLADLKLIQTFFQQVPSQPRDESLKIALQDNLLKCYQHRKVLMTFCLETLDLGTTLAQNLEIKQPKFASVYKQIVDFSAFMEEIHLDISFGNDVTELCKDFAKFQDYFFQWVSQIKTINTLNSKWKNVVDNEALVKKIIILEEWCKFRDLNSSTSSSPSDIYALTNFKKQDFIYKKNISKADAHKWYLNNITKHQDLPAYYATLRADIHAKELQHFDYMEIAKFKLMNLPACIYHYQNAMQGIMLVENLTRAKWAENIPVLRKRLSPYKIQVGGALVGMCLFVGENYFSGRHISHTTLKTVLACGGGLFNMLDLADYMQCDPLDLKEYNEALIWLAGMLMHVTLNSLFNGLSTDLALEYIFVYIVATSMRTAVSRGFEYMCDTDFCRQYGYLTVGAKWLLETVTYYYGQRWGGHIYHNNFAQPSISTDELSVCLQRPVECRLRSLKTLQLDEHADLKAANEAYKKLAMEYHPDKLSSDSNSDKFIEVSKAIGFLRKLK